MNGERGQSATIGFALVLGMTILGTTAVVVFGGSALSNTQDQSDLARAEQAMTLFDSQAAQVALGDSSVQTVDFGQSDGTYEVKPSSGKISIVQLDCDDDETNDDNDNTVTGGEGDDDAYILSPTELGSVVYESGNDEIAYQGGGVWRKSKRGGAVMVSPPEFHYRGATLTLPVVLTRGSGGASGQATATLTSTTRAVKVFPHSSETFPDRTGDTGENCWQDDTSEPFVNPIVDGEVIVRIQSEYYRAWGRYFESRTEGDVRYDHTTDEVTVELIGLAQVGEFAMPGDGGSVTVSGTASGHSTEAFNITLRPDDSDSATFNNLQWSMYVEDGDRQFEMHLKKSGSGGCPSTGITADLTIYYSDDGGDSYQGWHKSDAFSAKCDDLNGDGDDEIYLVADFVDDEDDDGSYLNPEAGDPELTYQSLGQDDLERFNPNGDFESTTTFSGHGDWESETYDSSVPDTESVDRLVNHYFAELPEEFELTVDDKGSNTVNEGASSGYLWTGGGAKYVNYLHVTENELKVDVN